MRGANDVQARPVVEVVGIDREPEPARRIEHGDVAPVEVREIHAPGLIALPEHVLGVDGDAQRVPRTPRLREHLRRPAADGSAGNRAHVVVGEIDVGRVDRQVSVPGVRTRRDVRQVLAVEPRAHDAAVEDEEVNVRRVGDDRVALLAREDVDGLAGAARTGAAEAVVGAGAAVLGIARGVRARAIAHDSGARAAAGGADLCRAARVAAGSAVLRIARRVEARSRAVTHSRATVARAGLAGRRRRAGVGATTAVRRVDHHVHARGAACVRRRTRARAGLASLEPRAHRPVVDGSVAVVVAAVTLFRAARRALANAAEPRRRRAAPLRPGQAVGRAGARHRAATAAADARHAVARSGARGAELAVARGDSHRERPQGTNKSRWMPPRTGSVE